MDVGDLTMNVATTENQEGHPINAGVRIPGVMIVNPKIEAEGEELILEEEGILKIHTRTFQEEGTTEAEKEELLMEGEAMIEEVLLGETEATAILKILISTANSFLEVVAVLKLRNSSMTLLLGPD